VDRRGRNKQRSIWRARLKREDFSFQQFGIRPSPKVPRVWRITLTCITRRRSNRALCEAIKTTQRSLVSRFGVRLQAARVCTPGRNRINAELRTASPHAHLQVSTSPEPFQNRLSSRLFLGPELLFRNERCVQRGMFGPVGSVGIRGIRSTMTFLAVLCMAING